jgi:predicted phosphoribosyltransferase
MTSQSEPLLFRDRRAAGRALAQALAGYANRPDVVVLALPRGGVPVGFEVARALAAPLDVFLVRKLGVPGHEELAMGALASGGIRVVNRLVFDQLPDAREILDRVTVRERAELERREREYRGDAPPPTVRDHVVILVDDGLATGSTMRAAAAALRQQHPARLIVAVPTAARSTSTLVATHVDEFVSLIQPDPFFAVGASYEDFSEVFDTEVRRLLREASRPV